MDRMSLKMVIISDLHCHYSKNGNDTYLTSDLLRTPIGGHPVESFIEIVKKTEDFNTDLTICPGDFTNKCDLQGFISGWNYIHEINDALGGNEIIATVGNHDVDSYGENSNYSLDIAQGIKKDFPLKKDQERKLFWAQGFVFIEREFYRVLVINSSHFHHNKSNSHNGKVDSNLLDAVQDYLEDQNDNKIQIALSHHHPIDHSRLDLGEEDKIINGSELLDILCNYNFDLFIHGHKHDALLRNHNSSSSNHFLPILSAGSFSAKTNLSWTSMRNQFHQIEIYKDAGTRSKGRIKTWTFFSRQGWKLSNDDEAFPPHSGFGYEGTINQLVDKIDKIVDNRQYVKWTDIVDKASEINNLIPSQTKELEKSLNEMGLAVYRQNGVAMPDCIFNKREE